MTAPPQGLAEPLRDRYTLERELGRGGMATVYLAHDLKHDRPVALKVLHAELAASLGPERFLREIRTTARLQHPHILPVLDSGEAAGQLWYTMPYVRGESLRDLLRRDVQLPIEIAVDLARQIALALDYAHREGVIHRDLKPENILLSDQQALVADFGVAKALAAGHEGQLTETGISVGTPAYMSPEQASADHVDGRSDVYALGCVVYEMLAGEPPFTGRTPQALLAKRALDPVPHVRTVRESVPEPLEQAITRALAKAPADRFQTAADFARALALSEVSLPRARAPAAVPAINAVATAPTPSMPIRGPRVPLAITALGLGLLLALGVFVAWLRSRPDPTAGNPKRLAVLPFENIGRPEDEYFADGITDEVRGKLAELPGLEVIARSSSVQYKKTSKSPRQIGRELGVQYLLTATVRWEKQAGSQSRVRVSPELVQVTTGSTRWQQPFEASLTNVFQVQADIAGRVAQALGVALGSGQRAQLAERPTQNLAAYDAYLRGLELRRTDAPAAAAEFERAVTLDTTFALAWAELALTRQYFHSVGFTALMQIDRSKADAEHALAINPKLPQGFYALGSYYMRREDYDSALAQYTRGLAVAPNNAILLGGVAEVDLRRGQWERVLQASRRLQVLDPRSADPVSLEENALLYSRRWPEALVAIDRGLALDSLRAWFYVDKMSALGALGDTSGIQEVMRVLQRRIGYSEAVEFLGRMYDIQWILPDSARFFLLRVRPSAMEGDTVDWALTLALTAHSLRESGRAKAYADTALGVLEAGRGQQKTMRPGLCLAYALAKRPKEARHSCQQLLDRPSPDATWQPFEVWNYAWAATTLGDIEEAVDAVERLVAGPGYYSRAWFRLDPTFAPLRGNPRFERLVVGK